MFQRSQSGYPSKRELTSRIPSPRRGATERLEQDEAFAALASGKNELSGLQTQIVYLIYYRGLSPRQAGRILGLKETSTYRVLRTALASLKHSLERLGFSAESIE